MSDVEVAPAVDRPESGQVDAELVLGHPQVLDHAGGADAADPRRRGLVVEQPPVRIEERLAGGIGGRRQEGRVLDHRLRRARPGDLRGDRRDAVAELIERQMVEHDVDQAPVRRRGVGLPELVLDVVADQRVRLLVLAAKVDPEPVLGVAGVGAGTRAQIRDQPVAGPDP